MPRAIRHPFNRHRYSAEGERLIRVESDTTWGLFNDRGDWLEGPLREADPTFCLWLASGWALDQRKGNTGR